MTRTLMLLQNAFTTQAVSRQHDGAEGQWDGRQLPRPGMTSSFFHLLSVPAIT